MRLIDAAEQDQRLDAARGGEEAVRRGKLRVVQHAGGQCARGLDLAGAPGGRRSVDQRKIAGPHLECAQIGLAGRLEKRPAISPSRRQRPILVEPPAQGQYVLVVRLTGQAIGFVESLGVRGIRHLGQGEGLQELESRMRIAVPDRGLSEIVQRQRISVPARGLGQGQPRIVGRRSRIGEG